MSHNIEEELKEIRNTTEKSKERKLRAQVQVEAAESRIEANHEILKTKFNVSTIDEAKNLLEKLDAQIESKIQEAKAALQEAQSA